MRCPENVVRLAGRNALSELAVVVGVEFPLGLLVFGASDFYFDAVDWMIVWTPDRAEDESVALVAFLRWSRS